MTMSTESVAQLRGADVVDASGDKVGTVELMNGVAFFMRGSFLSRCRCKRYATLLQSREDTRSGPAGL